MEGKVKKEYSLKCERKELTALHEAIVTAMKHTSECDPIMDDYEVLKDDIAYILEM